MTMHPTLQHSSHPFLVVVLALLLPALLFAQGRWEVIFSFPSPASVSNGLAFDGYYLWNTNNYGPGTIYKIDPASGITIGHITPNPPLEDPGDVTWLNGYLWVVEENYHRLVKIDPANGNVIDYIGPIGSGIVSGAYQLEGVESDGVNLWVNAQGDYMFEMDPVTKTLLHWYKKSWAGYADGMTFAWNSLFTVSNEYGIIEVSPCTGVQISSFKAPAGLGVGPEGLTFDGEYLWYTENTTNTIYKIRLVDDYNTKRRVNAKAQMDCGDGTETPAVGAASKGFECSAMPNPVNGRSRITVRMNSPWALPQALDFRVYDIQGRFLHSINAKNVLSGHRAEYTIQNRLPEARGCYFIRFHYRSALHTLKVLNLG